MKKQLFLNFFLMCSISLFGAFEDLPQVIDFSSFKGSVEDSNYDELAWHLGFAALNYAPEINGVFSILKRDYQIDTVVETGTHRGASTRLFAILFEHVHTIEISESSYRISKEFLKDSPNVTCHLGSSEDVLRAILPSLQEKRILFYLDAHWNQNWPLRQELEEISYTHKDNCIVVIDDFKVPGRRDVLFDSYGPHECSFEYVEGQLNKVFSDYTVHYVIPRAVSSRAKIIAIPKSWK